MHIAIVGGGIGGLTLALSLHQAGIACRVFEAAPAWQPLGVGINLLPHAMRELTELALGASLERVAVATREVVFCNRFGQFIRREPRGRAAGYPWPQLSIHRADLHAILVVAVRDRLGPDALALGASCTGIEQDATGVTLHFENGADARAAAAIGSDGFHSAVRKHLHPAEGPLSYQGIHMWRGVTRAKPFLTGASMVIGGWLEVGKLVVYPVRNAIDDDGRQLINWVAERTFHGRAMQDWNLAGRLEDFLPGYADWRFDWLDCAALLRDAEQVLETPMVDREPLPFWTQGCVTLLGDAAHPMYPRGSNGAAQAAIDARILAECLAAARDPAEALAAYEQTRRETTAKIVRTNRAHPPDFINIKVEELVGDQPFDDLDRYITQAELHALSENYKRIAGFSLSDVSGAPRPTAKS